MADWTNIADSAIDPDAPLTSELAYAWRDNVIAAFEGASGAPRLADAALPTSSASATASGRAWVAYRSALMDRGQIGSMSLMRYTSNGTTILGGDTISGSSLVFADAAGGGVGSPATGTWRNMGGNITGSSSASPSASTLFLRVS